jgi:hypothetical protein
MTETRQAAGNEPLEIDTLNRFFHFTRDSLTQLLRHSRLYSFRGIVIFLPQLLGELGELRSKLDIGCSRLGCYKFRLDFLQRLSIGRTQWAQFLHPFGEFCYQFHIERGFGSRGPVQGEPVRMNPCLCEKLPAEVLSDDGVIITNLVMTFPELSPAHKYAIGACRESFDDEQGIHSAGTHNSDCSDVGWVLKTGYTRRIGRCIAAPIAEEAQYSWFVRSFDCHLNFFPRRPLFEP